MGARVVTDLIREHIGWRRSWLVACLLAVLLWLLHHGLRPAQPGQLRSVSGTVESVTYPRRSRRSSASQFLQLATAQGRETYRLPRYRGHHRHYGLPGVDVGAGARVELLIGPDHDVYTVRVGRREVIDYATARSTIVHRQILPGILALTATLSAMLLALLSAQWPKLSAWLGVDPSTRPAGSMAHFGRLADLQINTRGIATRYRALGPKQG